MRQLVFACSALFKPFDAACIKRRIICIIVFGIEVFLYIAQSFTEALEMHDFTFAQKLNGISHIGIVNQTQQIVIRAFCSAAISSNKSAIASPVDCKVAAENGVPLAACG